MNRLRHLHGGPPPHDHDLLFDGLSTETLVRMLLEGDPANDWTGELAIEETAPKSSGHSVEKVIEAFRKEFLALNRTANRELVTMLADAHKQIVGSLIQAGIFDRATVTEDQVRAAIAGDLAELRRKFGTYLQRSMVDSAEVALLREETLFQSYADMLPGNLAKGLGSALSKSFIASEVTKILYDSTLGMRIRLSDKIWILGEYTHDQVTKVVRAGLLDGDDAVTIAKRLERVLVPRKGMKGATWSHATAPDRLKKIISSAPRGLRTRRGTVAYNYLRIARSEMFRAHKAAHQVRVMGLQEMFPFTVVEGIAWVLSNSHPRQDVCFLDPETRISTPTGETPIAKVRPGDSVLTHSGRIRRVEAWTHIKGRTDPFVELRIAGRDLVVTDSHPILTPHGWVPAGKLAAADEVVVFHSVCGGDLDLVVAGYAQDHEIDPCVGVLGAGEVAHGHDVVHLEREIVPAAHATGLLGRGLDELGLNAHPRVTASRGAAPIVGVLGAQLAVSNGSALLGCVSPALRGVDAAVVGVAGAAVGIGPALRRAEHAVVAGECGSALDTHLDLGSMMLQVAGERAELLFGVPEDRSADQARLLGHGSFGNSGAGLGAVDLLGDRLLGPSRVLQASGARSDFDSASGACLHSSRFSTVLVERVKHKTPTASYETWNLTVEGDHSYIANGVVVHNCDSWASDNTYNLGPGIYPPGSLPMGHPNELCNQVTQLISFETMGKRLQAFGSLMQRPEYAARFTASGGRGTLRTVFGNLNDQILGYSEDTKAKVDA